MASDAEFSEFKASLRGALIQPGEAGYDQARKVYNGMIDRRPRVIVHCVDVADVITAVKFGRAGNLLVAVRGGGHNAGGLGVCDDGMVIDLSRISYVHVDAAKKTVRCGGGTTWGQVDHATHAFGLAVPAGIIASTGVGGLTLGGGIGHLTRQCGLTIDNLLEAEIVLADGTVVVANSSQHADLFWAVRGGGGNFGIVTSFLFKAHPIHTDYAGPMFWALEDTAEMMRWYRGFIAKAPETLNGFFAILTVPAGPPFPPELHNKKVCGVVWCYTGPLKQAEKVFKPIRAFKKPLLDFVGPIPHPALQGMFDPIFPAGLQWYWKADFMGTLSDEAIRRHVEHGAKMPTWQSTMHLYPINGRAAKVKNSATPWCYRDAMFAQVMVGVDPDPGNKDKLVTWARDYFEALHPLSAGGAYVNFMMDEGDDRVRATYGKNYARLAKIKKKYDPKNFFRVNQNITPAK